MTYKLPEGWREVELGEVVKLRNGKKAQNIKELGKGKYPLYGGNGKYGSVDDYNSENSLAIGRVGAYCGSVHKVNEKFWISDNAIEVKPLSKDIISHEYLYYRLDSFNLNRLHQGTSQPLLNQNILKNIKWFLPPYKEQKAIADTLSSLDNKIELNNKIIENLEQQAQAIFKHWFVDFEFPDGNGNPYKSSGGEMVESELGMIPKGWEVKELGDISKRDNKSIKFPKEGIYNHFSIPALDKYRLPTLDDGLTIKSNKYLIDNKHILLSRLNPRIKRLWRPICIGENCVCSTEFIVIKSNEIELRSLLYSIMESNGFYDFILENVTGSTNSHQRVSPPSVVLEYKIALPKDDLVYMYTDIVDPIYIKIDNNIIENQKLSKLRDTLLPKLMSGELRIPLD